MSRKTTASAVSTVPPSPMKPLCFVIGPIGERGTEVNKAANWLLKGVFKPVLEAEEFGYHVKRADEDATPGSIATAVILDVLNADLVIADLTGFNPNVFYELGLRHMSGKPTIHVIGEKVDLPFDNQDQRTIFIDRSDIDALEESKLTLAAMVRSTRLQGHKVSNPVTQANGMLALTQSADDKDRIVADLTSRIETLERREREQSALNFSRRSAADFSGGFTSGRSGLLGIDRKHLVSQALLDSMSDDERATMMKLQSVLPAARGSGGNE